MSKSKTRLGLTKGGKADKKKGRTIPVDLGHNERFLLNSLRQEATQKANAVSFALWERITEKTKWTEDELEILSEATDNAKQEAETVAKRCPKCSTIVFGTDAENITLDQWLYELDADGEMVKDADDEPVPLIPEREFRLSGYQHKMVVDILAGKAKSDELTPQLWPLFKLFVGTDHLEDDDVEDDEPETPIEE